MSLYRGEPCGYGDQVIEDMQKSIAAGHADKWAERMKAAIDMIVKLRGDLNALKEDAERYRWLHKHADHFEPPIYSPEAIDAAIAAGKEGQHDK